MAQKLIVGRKIQDSNGSDAAANTSADTNALLEMSDLHDSLLATTDNSNTNISGVAGSIAKLEKISRAKTSNRVSLTDSLNSSDLSESSKRMEEDDNNEAEHYSSKFSTPVSIRSPSFAVPLTSAGVSTALVGSLAMTAAAAAVTTVSVTSTLPTMTIAPIADLSPVISACETSIDFLPQLWTATLANTPTCNNVTTPIPITTSAVTVSDTSIRSTIEPSSTAIALQSCGEEKVDAQRLEEEVRDWKEENYIWSQKYEALLAKFQTQGGANNEGSSGNGSQTSEVIEKYKKEIQQQETLLAAFHKENEKLLAENKELKRQINDLKAETAIELSKKANKISALESTSVSSTPLLEFQAKYDRLRQEMELRDAERKCEVDALKQQKRELELKLEGLDWDKMHKDDLEIRQLKLSFKQQQDVHKDEVQELQNKIRWYVENQDIITKNDELVASQTQTIANLRERVIELQNALKATNKRSSSLSSKKRGSQGTEDKSKGFPGSTSNAAPPTTITTCAKAAAEELVSAVMASAKLSEEESHKVKALQRKIQSLQKDLDEQVVQSEKSIRSLRMESDKLKATYEAKLASLEEEFVLRLKGATNKKATELMKQLEETRAYYTKKIRELESQIMNLKKEQRKTTRSIGGVVAGGTLGARTLNSSTTPKASAAATAGDVVSATGDAAKPFAETDFDPTSHEDENMIPVKADHVVPRAKFSALQAENTVLAEENSRLQAELRCWARSRPFGSDGGPAFRPGLQPAVSETSQSVLLFQQQLQNALSETNAFKVVAQQSQEFALKTQKDCAEKISDLLRDHHSAIQSLQLQQKQELGTMRAHLQEEFRSSSKVILPEGIDTSEGRVAYLRAVATRLQMLEYHCQLREAEAKKAVEEVKRMTAAELELEKKRFQIALDAKSAELQRLQAEVDSLLQQASSVQATLAATFAGSGAGSQAYQQIGRMGSNGGRDAQSNSIASLSMSPFFIQRQASAPASTKLSYKV